MRSCLPAKKWRPGCPQANHLPLDFVKETKKTDLIFISSFEGVIFQAIFQEGQQMEEKEVNKDGVKTPCCSGWLCSHSSRLNWMVRHRAKNEKSISECFLFDLQVRLLLQLLLTILFLVYFGLPSLDRFRMKRVR